MIIPHQQWTSPVSPTSTSKVDGNVLWAIHPLIQAGVHTITCLGPWTSGSQLRSTRHWGKTWHGSCPSNGQPFEACGRMLPHDFQVTLWNSHSTKILKGDFKYLWELPGKKGKDAQRQRTQKWSDLPKREKRTGSVIPEFWALATNPETILLGQCLWKFLLQVRDVLWGNRRAGRKECTGTFFYNFLAQFVFVNQYANDSSLFPCKSKLLSHCHGKLNAILQSFHWLKIQVATNKISNREISHPLPTLPPA